MEWNLSLESKILCFSWGKWMENCERPNRHLGEHASSLLLAIPVPAGSSLDAGCFQHRPSCYEMFYCPGHWLSVSLREPGASQGWEWCLIHWSLIDKTAANSSWDGPALDKIKGASHKWAHLTFKLLSTFNHGFLLMIPIKKSKKALPSCSRAPL